MSIERLHIKEFLNSSAEAIIIDVRSPGEFHHAHIPGSVNVPLFTDEERKAAGTAYKQQSREKAIKIGLDFFGPKMRGIVEEVEGLISNGQQATGKESNCQLLQLNSGNNCIFLYCWRGGMRSSAVAWLLNLYGFKVFVLAGGYKSYRNYVLESFQQKFSLKILGGYTGSGKTEILKELEKNGEAVINLEELASHKGSAFGNLNMPAQPTQEMFENLLAQKIWGKLGIENADSRLPTPDSPIWFEDESQRIGLVNIPNELWQTMRNSPVFFVEIPFEKRLEHITEEYSCMDKNQLMDAIVRISKRLGGVATKNSLAALESGDHKECFRILLKYYDKHYLKALHNRDNFTALLQLIPCKSVTAENSHQLLAKHHVV